MARPLTPFGDLGARVASALDLRSRERAESIEVARQNFQDRTLLPAPARSRRPALIWAAAAACSLALAALLLWIRQPAKLEFTADGEVAALQTWLSAPNERPLALRFSDGSQWRVEPSSRVRVVEVSERGASVALENGSLHADVVHTATSSWRVIAGPMTVRVTGTRFDLAWSTVSEEFVISVIEGSVEVAGGIVGQERPLRAGETLRVSLADQRLELSKGPEARARFEAPNPLAAPADPAPALGAEPMPAAELPAGGQPSPAARMREPDWRELAKSGSLRKAFFAAEASGFETACAAATPAELLQLGDAARLAGRADRSSQALLALRQRYPNDPRRAAAAFALGKVAFDQTHSYGEAADWFRTCVREQPGGSLVREASGRLIEALKKSGNSAAAKQAARDYLARFPDGPHADVARSVLE